MVIARVKFTEWKRAEGKHHHEQVHGGEGDLLAFGVDTDEGMGSFSTGIIKLDDNSIRNVHVENITFLSNPIN